MTYKPIDWYSLFFLESILWSLKSHDPQTQCGCVLVARDNTIVSTGYNGFIRGIDDSALPNTRPDKYPYMIHAEHNAILNCARQGKSTLGLRAFITGIPCANCLQYMWQAGIHDIYYSDFNAPVMCTGNEYDATMQKLQEVMSGPFKLNMVYIPSHTLGLADALYKLLGKAKL
jgi:dCMP deaminase